MTRPVQPARFGRLLATLGRHSDIACRYGGEEFCLLMPGTDRAAAGRKLELLLARWCATRFTLDAGELCGLTFSAGVADSSVASQEAGALLKQADDALFNAKRSGRSRVVVAAPAVECGGAAR